MDGAGPHNTGARNVTIEYLETDETDEGPIHWYRIDGETYGTTEDGKILDSGGCPLPEGCAEVLRVRRAVDEAPDAGPHAKGR